MTQDLFRIWKDLTGTKDNFSHFQGSNVHRLFHVFCEKLEQIEENFVRIQAKQFTYWSNHNQSIQGSLGSSYEGWLRAFSGMCHGLDIVSHMENPQLKPGEITIYFDDLFSSEDEVREAFLKCKNVAEPTVGGDRSIQVVYSNGQVRTYTYFNLEPKDYTPIQVQIKVTYQKRSLQYKDTAFVDHFTQNFHKSNRINQPFYPESYMDVSLFPGVADFQIETKLDQDISWSQDIRKIPSGQKFTLSSVVMSS